MISAERKPFRRLHGGRVATLWHVSIFIGVCAVAQPDVDAPGAEVFLQGALVASVGSTVLTELWAGQSVYLGVADALEALSSRPRRTEAPLNDIGSEPVSRRRPTSCRGFPGRMGSGSEASGSVS